MCRMRKLTNYQGEPKNKSVVEDEELLKPKSDTKDLSHISLVHNTLSTKYIKNLILIINKFHEIG